MKAVGSAQGVPFEDVKSKDKTLSVSACAALARTTLSVFTDAEPDR